MAEQPVPSAEASKSLLGSSKDDLLQHADTLEDHWVDKAAVMLDMLPKQPSRVLGVALKLLSNVNELLAAASRARSAIDQQKGADVSTPGGKKGKKSELESLRAEVAELKQSLADAQ
eukprot:6575178-Prymnesium_polylepis.1